MPPISEVNIGDETVWYAPGVATLHLDWFVSRFKMVTGVEVGLP